MIKPLVQKVLVAFNGSESSLHSLMYALIMAKQIKCQVKVVFVVDTVTIRQLTMSKFVVKEEGADLETHLLGDGERNLNYAVNLAKSKGLKIETELRKGAVWSEIITAADQFKADVILIGGNTTESALSNKRDVVSTQNSEIIGSAHCSVMLVRQPHIEQLFKLA